MPAYASYTPVRIARVQFKAESVALSRVFLDFKINEIYGRLLRMERAVPLIGA